MELTLPWVFCVRCNIFGGGGSHRAGRTMSQPLDALVLNAPLRQSLATVRSLGRRGLHVAVAGDFPKAPTLASRWCREAYDFPPEGDSAAYLARLDECLERLHPRVVIPLHDATIALLRQNRARFTGRTTLALAEDSALQVAVNKERTFAAARRLGLKVPRQIVIQQGEDASLAIEEIGLPAVVKPCESWLTNGRTGIRLGAKLVFTPEEARRAIQAILWFGEAAQYQAVLTGRREAVSLLYARGRIHARFAQWAMRTQPPIGGQSIVRQSIPVPPDIGGQAEALIRDLKLEGYSEVEFRRDHAGVPYLMEINPRLSASVEIAIRCGVDFPFLLYQWAAGETIQAEEAYETGRWMRHLGGDIESLLDTLHLRGKPGIPHPTKVLLDFSLSFCRPMNYDYFQWRDPLPALRATAQFGRTWTRRLFARMRKDSL